MSVNAIDARLEDKAQKFPKRKENQLAKFPETIEACRASDKSQWKIGAALLREADEDAVQAVADELDKNGLNFSTSYLSQLRRTAEAFPSNRRHDLPWKVHAEAGNPDSLDVIVKAARKEGQKVTIWYVGDVLRRIRAEERARREQAVEEAENERQEAIREKREAIERQMKAKDQAERERAKAERDRAAERERKAREKKSQVKIAPRAKDVPPPKEQDVPTLAAVSFATGQANKAQVLAEQVQERLKPKLDDLSAASIKAITEAALEAAAAWRKVADTVRSTTTDKRGHLSVINE